MRRQDWSQLMSVAALLGGLLALARGRLQRAFVFLSAAIAADAAGRRLSRGEPTPLPYSQRWLLALPRPAAPLGRALEPRQGQRLLEIGPGLGQDAVAVAESVGANGRVDVLDVQQEMLDATASRARQRGMDNVVGALAEPSGRLPYEDGAFDAAYLVSVLGEIPDQQLALAELRRVLKPEGRLIVSEVLIDPDFISPRRLSRMAEAAGLRLERRFGPPFAYHARLVAV